MNEIRHRYVLAERNIKKNIRKKERKMLIMANYKITN